MARSEEEIKNLNVAAQEFINSVASMASNLKELSRGIEQETGETSAKSIVQRREFLDLADKLSKYSKEDLADKRKANSFNNTFNKAKSKQVAKSKAKSNFSPMYSSDEESTDDDEI